MNTILVYIIRKNISLLILMLFSIISVQVNAQLMPVADAYINGAAASAALNYGTDLALRVKKGSSAIYSRKKLSRVEENNNG